MVSSFTLFRLDQFTTAQPGGSNLSEAASRRRSIYHTVSYSSRIGVGKSRSFLLKQLWWTRVSFHAILLGTF
jgi:hypothetical protein